MGKEKKKKYDTIEELDKFRAENAIYTTEELDKLMKEAERKHLEDIMKDVPSIARRGKKVAKKD